MKFADGEPEVGGEQLQVDTLGPPIGGRYHNRNTGTIVTVLQVNQARHAWVTIRVLGVSQTMPLARFERAFTPYP